VPRLPLLAQWRDERVRAQRAERYVALLMEAPSEPLVSQLATMTDGDTDHAAWEWRYARRALGLIVAERFAQDDRTVSEIAAVLSERQLADPAVAPARRGLVQDQFNERLSAYRGAVANRISSDPLPVRLGFVLLRFERPTVPTAQAAATLGLLLDGMASDLNQALAELYGRPALLEPTGTAAPRKGAPVRVD
jgi:hypothetical protein